MAGGSVVHDGGTAIRTDTGKDGQKWTRDWERYACTRESDEDEGQHGDSGGFNAERGETAYGAPNGVVADVAGTWVRHPLLLLLEGEGDGGVADFAETSRRACRAHQRPDLFGAQRHVYRGYAERSQRVQYRVHDGGRRGDGSGFTDTFCPKGVAGSGCFDAIALEGRELAGFGERVVQQGAAEDLSILII